MKMKVKKRITQLLTALLLVSYIPLLAQETKLLTLNDAIDLSVKNSHVLKNNKAAIDEASAAVKQATDNKLPDVSVSGSYLWLPFSPSISSNIKLGGGSDSTGGGSPKVKQAIYGIASVSMPIYAGGRLKYAIESAKYLQKAAELDADDNREEVIYNTIDAFANLYKAKAAVAIVKENLEQSRQRVNDFTNLEKNGVLARNDLLKAELQASNNELAVLDAESSLQIANINMNIMLGLPKQTQLVPDSASLDAKPELKTIEDYEQLALQNRKDIAALSYRKKSAALGIKSASAEYLPSISLTGGYIAVDVPNFLTATNIVNVGVGVKYSLSSLWKTDAKVKRAKAVEQEIAANEDQLRDNVQLQVNKVYQQYLLNVKKTDVYGKAVEQAAENYKITKNKYDNTLATTTDLLDADVAQLQAKLNYSFSKTDAVVAYNKLLQLTGLLFNK
jgi:outer membrane protein TolC